jgi:hypothetical protein
LQVTYDFRASEASANHDRSGQKPPIDLRIAAGAPVKQSSAGLEINEKTLIRSEQPAARLIQSIKQSGRLTIEAWLRPANATQSGPARIVTLSRNPNERNFTLGQDQDKFEVRLRTTKSSTNGIPALVAKAKSARTDWTHVVFTFDGAGQSRIYIDGELNAEARPGGDLKKWHDGFELAVANELSGDRPWLGSLQLVAIYDRDLSRSRRWSSYVARSTTSTLKSIREW